MTRSARTASVVLAATAVLLLAGCTAKSPTIGAPAPLPAAEPPTADPSMPPYDATALRRPKGRLLGVASEGGPGDLAPVAAFAAKAGRQPDLREYYQTWGEEFDPAANTALWRAGRLPMLALVPDQVPLAQIASGAEDGYLARLAHQVRSYQGPLLVDFAPEMNAPWNAWGPGHATADEFVRAWRRVHDAFQAAHADNAIWVWAPHVTDTGAPAPIKPYFPGPEYVDWIGLTGFYGPEDGTDFAGLFAPSVRTLRALSDRPLLIAETGVAEGPRKPRQIADLFAGAAGTDGLVGLVWYDLPKAWPGSTVPTDWRADSSPAAAAAVAKAGAGWHFG